MTDEVDQASIEVGAAVFDAHGDRIGVVRVAYPHYALVEDDGAQPPVAFRVPYRAIALHEAGSLNLNLPREALDRATPLGRPRADA